MVSGGRIDLYDFAECDCLIRSAESWELSAKCLISQVAGEPGFEPRLAESESIQISYYARLPGPRVAAVLQA
jgi:hypothetical protein